VTLLGYRHAIRDAAHAHLNQVTLIVVTGYFFVWATFGVAIYPAVYELVEGGDDMADLRASCSTSDRPGPAARRYLSVQPVEMKRIEEVQKRQNW
jgi:hypothetical protein